jgi:AcrR family transcriptional regulator
MHSAAESGPRRRRGAALEDALLTAAWGELAERGYANFTLDAVAARAGTSRPVIARRWATKHELVRAAIAQASRRTAPRDTDTGSLRGDLIALLQEANETRVDLAVILGVQLGGFLQETGSSLIDLRDLLLHGQGHALDAAFSRAVARGEVDPARLTPRVKSLPYDLFRHHVLMTLTPMAPDSIEEIVDTIVLPLVR